MGKTKVKELPEKTGGGNKKRKIIIIVIAAVLAAAIITGTVIGVVVYTKNREYKAFDYLNEDLSKYIYISPENYNGYKGYEVEIAIDEITDESVQTAIMQILVGERGDPADFGRGDTLATIEAGDDILLYFQAYKVNSDGSKGEAVDGLGNFTVEKEDNRTYTVGDGSLDKLGLNLEYKLIGAELPKYTYCEIASDGAIRADDIIFLTYSSYAFKDGVWTEHSAERERINLSDGVMDAKFGAGFEELILGQTIGKAVSNPTSVPYSTAEYSQIRYNNIKVEYVMRPTDQGQEPLRVYTTIPCTYSDESLQGTKVVFEMYISYAVKYDVPELTETFIKDTLKISVEELEKYEGDDTVSQFHAYTRELLEKRDQREIDAILIEAMWAHYYNIAEFKELPKDEINRLVNIQRAVIEKAYEADDNGYDSLDEYANAYVAYLGYELVWTDYLKQVAEAEIKEKLIFYYVARAEKLLPSQEEFDSLSKKIIEEDIDYLLRANGIVRDKYDTDEEYNSAAQPYRKQVEDTYADKALLEYTVHLEYAEARMSKFANVKYKNPAKDNANQDSGAE